MVKEAVLNPLQYWFYPAKAIDDMNEKCVIVIPMHKPDPSRYELISLEQCYRVLGDHPIYIIAPTGLDLAEYKKVIPNLTVKSIDPVWLSSLLNYNKLKLSNFFYNLFDGYKYLLTYELDAFVFSNDVDYWCDKNFDYIGAPWFKNWDVPGAESGSELVAVGNSGFSIRNISAMQRGIKKIYYQDPTKIDKQPKDRYVRGLKKLFTYAFNLVTGENSTLQNANLLNEDWVITQLVAKKTKGFRLAGIAHALRFSFEVKPEVLFKMNHNNLPMGCHAWWRYNLNFWQPYIENFGYKLP